MRLTLVPVIGGLMALLALPVHAQHPLPARTFEPSLPIIAPLPAPPVTEWWRNGGPRIRPRDQRATTALRVGSERSSVFRGLLHAIDQGDVFVYVAVDPQMGRGLMGRLTFAGSAGKYRYLRVMLNPELGTDVMVATLAHELRHVLEVLEHPEVVSETTLGALYSRIGHSNRAGGVPGFETDAALDTGMEVRRELTLGTAAALARRREAEARSEQR